MWKGRSPDGLVSQYNIAKLEINCETSTGYINKQKYSPKRCDFQLSSVFKNMKNGLESVEK
jgi:hypothetical protein